VLGGADRMLAEVSEVARHRSELRTPADLLRRIRAGRPSVERPPVEDLLAQPPPRLKPRRELTGEGVIRFIRRDMLAGFAMASAREELGAFRSTLLDLRDQGIEVAVVVMPVSDAYRRAHPHGPADYRSWLGAVRAATAGTGAVLVDRHGGHDDADFPDSVHLAPAVAPEFSRSVARELADEGW
jgi:hypothetical protein